MIRSVKVLAAAGALEHESWGGGGISSGVQFSNTRTSIWKSSQNLIKRENEKHHDRYRLGLDLAMSECGVFFFSFFMKRHWLSWGVTRL